MGSEVLLGIRNWLRVGLNGQLSEWREQKSPRIGIGTWDEKVHILILASETKEPALYQSKLFVHLASWTYRIAELEETHGQNGFPTPVAEPQCHHKQLRLGSRAYFLLFWLAAASQGVGQREVFPITYGLIHFRWGCQGYSLGPSTCKTQLGGLPI